MLDFPGHQQGGAYTRPLLSSTSLVSATKTHPNHPLIPLNTPLTTPQRTPWTTNSAQVELTNGRVKLSPCQQGLELGWQVRRAVRDVQVADAQHEHHRRRRRRRRRLRRALVGRVARGSPVCARPLRAGVATLLEVLRHPVWGLSPLKCMMWRRALSKTRSSLALYVR